jgi:probable F420-dependent oxidoreductase
VVPSRRRIVATATETCSTAAVKIDTQISAPLGEVVTQARGLREQGYDGVFTFEGPRDVFLPLVEAALVGDLDLYTNVAIAFPRSPVHLAHLAWDLQRLSEGRFALGLGSQVRAHVERRYGSAFDHPVDRMREWVLAVKAVFDSWQSGAPLDFRGRFTTHTLMPPLFNPGPLDWGAPPVWVGAVGPRMTRMVAEVADGLLVHPFHTEQFLTDAMLPVVDEGLDAARRSRDAFSFAVDVIVCTGRTDEEQAAADAGCKTLLGFYGSTPAYRPVLDLHGWGEVQPALNQLSKSGGWADMPALVTDEMLEQLTVRGSPAAVAGELRRRYGQVADRVGFYLPYGHEPELVAAVTDGLRDAS